MKKITAQERDLTKAIQALEGIIDQNERTRTYNVDGLVQKLIVAYCDEVTATWQYFTALHKARGVGRVDALPEYEEHIKEEAAHLEDIAHRLQELGGGITFDLNEVSVIGHEWKRIITSNVKQQLEILIEAEREARKFYQEIIHYANAIQDWQTSSLFKKIIKDETKHEFDLKRLFEQL